MPASTAIVWFRRDLRLHDHPALHAALAGFERVIPVFVLDRRLYGGRFASGSRTAFMLGALRELDAGLRERGGGLVIRAGEPELELPKLALDCGAASVLWTSDAGPFARERDRRVTRALEQQGVRPQPQPGSHCADISVPRTGSGGPYTVFTPFWKAWEALGRRGVHRAPAALPALPAALPKGRLPSLAALELRDEVPEPVRVPGEAAARRAAARWLDGPIDHYADRHDDLRGGTSELSPYLRWGQLSPRELEARVMRRGGAGAAAYRRQLAWRDFFAHVLLFHPGSTRQELQERFRSLEWDDDADLLEAWQEGRTGYPLVDAGMRQLRRTGFMHNRARMVVGSFLTKDLHLDWRHGEAWFERLLLDGEPSQNNGNWQWIASTGADPAPYSRRMFNPVLQQKRFDPRGAYVRRWVPELEGLDDAQLAEPWTLSERERAQAGAGGYPAPVVDHALERRRALERYGAATSARDRGASAGSPSPR